MSNKRLEEYKDEYQSIKMSNESYKQMLLYMEKAKKERTQNMKKQRKSLKNSVISKKFVRYRQFCGWKNEKNILAKNKFDNFIKLANAVYPNK